MKKGLFFLSIFVVLIGIGIALNNNSLEFKSSSSDQRVNDYLMRTNSKYKISDFEVKNPNPTTSQLTSDKLPNCHITINYENSNSNTPNGILTTYSKDNYNKDDHYKCIEYGMGISINTTILKNQTLVTEVYNIIKAKNWKVNEIYKGYTITVNDDFVNVQKYNK